MHSTNVSFKHLRAQTQFRFIVKNEFVATKGIADASSQFGFGSSTLNVAQQSSSFSIRKTLEHFSSHVSQFTFSFVVGILHGVPFEQQVNNIIGLVLQFKLDAEQPKKPLSHVSKQLSMQFAFC